jgi:hypothetical protein
MPPRLASGLVASVLRATSVIQIYLPGRSAEVTGTILALVIGEFIWAVKAGLYERIHVPGLGVATIWDRRPRFAIGRGEPLSHRLIPVSADDVAE